MNDRELIERLKDKAERDPSVVYAGEEMRLAAARLTALAEESERLRRAVRQAHVDLGADCGVTERDCVCEFCTEVPR